MLMSLRHAWSVEEQSVPKIKNPRKRKWANIDGPLEEDKSLEEIDKTLNESHDNTKEIQVPEIVENEEISINYVVNGNTWNLNEIDVDEIFSYNVACDIVEQNEDLEPTSIKECSRRDDWPKWK